MAQIKDGTLVITVENCDGEVLNRLQKGLLLAIEQIGTCDQSGCEEHQNAVYHLSELLRQMLLTDSQTNVGIGNRPYKEPEKVK